MSYYFSKTIDKDFDKAVLSVKKSLKEEGFGVLFELDMQKTFKEKIGAEMNKYLILGVCNPNFGFKALQTEPNIGTMIPCNVVVRELTDKKVEISAINPVAQMSIVDNEELINLAKEIQKKLSKIIHQLE
ncbi:DUF302 domain-containing protein [Deferribacter autotrophicus]|uniref:DUF302 domain-containing protein n=1 Tax=Deferribacter autotrophicus TaxID=500465 RepID=A0A5A8F3P5_9BACT|nr:DUF302 domain-containing protein [Deferribacter autotrophicus]KAA0258824.1 DUF302 domain-containing protein [Deferribacter autotrophicus]